MLLKKLIRYFLTLPADIVVWPLLLLLIHLPFGSNLTWTSGVLRTTLREDSWPMNATKKFGGWYKSWGGTTACHAVMLAPNQHESVFRHELVHVEQAEANAAYGFVLFVLLACLGWWWVGLLVWPLTPLMAYLAASLIAWLRSEPNAYKGNLYEEAAYAIAGTGCRTAAPDVKS